MNGSGITYDQKLALFAYYSSKNRCGCKELIKLFLNTVMKRPRFIGEAHEVLFFSDVKREDHRRLFDLICQSCGRDKGYLVLQTPKGPFFAGIKTCFGRVKWLKQLKHLVQPVRNEKLDLSFRHRLAVYFTLVFYENLLKAAEKFDFAQTKAVVVLADVAPAQHILVNHAKQKQIKTVTAQHGIYQPDINKDAIDILNYWRVSADVLLSWGESTNQLFHKHNPELICATCGNPQIQPKSYPEDNELIGIAMDIPAHLQQNRKMLEVAEKYAKENHRKIRIRLHPTDQESNYTINPEVSEFHKDIDAAGVILAYTSTMLFTYMVLGKKILRYQDELPYYELDYRICFNDDQSFLRAMKNSAEIDYTGITKCHLEAIGDHSIQLYRKFFDRLNFDFKGGEQ